MSTSFGVIGGDDTQDFLELVQAKNETASKRKLDADQLFMVRTLYYPDRSMRKFLDFCHLFTIISSFNPIASQESSS